MPSPIYATQDPYLASFLLNQGADLLGHTRLAPKRVEFRFAADERLHQVLRIYWSRKLFPVVPAGLFDALRKLKSRGDA